jgi:type VII secretion protein EccB
MRTRREQVQAHRFLTRRIVSAMLTGEPETTDQPMRRLGQAVFGSAMVATIILAAIGVIGFVTGGGKALEPNTLVVEKETGAKYIYLADGPNGENRLHPVLNYASARLLLGTPNPPQRTMSQKALQNLPRGLTYGIPGAPDALPSSKSLLKLPWTICSMPNPVQPVNGRSRAIIGSVVPGGHAIADGKEALLVSVRDSEGKDKDYLISGEHKYEVGGDKFLSTNEILTTLQLVGEPLPVTQQFINAVPSGADLSVFTIDGAGEPGRFIAGTQYGVGTVFKAGETFYVMTRAGLVKVGQVYATLRVERDQGGNVIEITPSDAGNALAKDLKSVELPNYLQDIPTLLNPAAGAAAVACVSYGLAGAEPVWTTAVYRDLPPELSSTKDVILARQNPADKERPVDEIVIPGGRGTLVQPVSSPNGESTGNTIYLITDAGVRYAIGSSTAGSVDAAVSLGYGGADVVELPMDILKLIPSGTNLNRDLAARPVVNGDSGSAPAPVLPSASPSLVTTSPPAG